MPNDCVWLMLSLLAEIFATLSNEYILWLIFFSEADKSHASSALCWMSCKRHANKQFDISYFPRNPPNSIIVHKPNKQFQNQRYQVVFLPGEKKDVIKRVSEYCSRRVATPARRKIFFSFVKNVGIF